MNPNNRIQYYRRSLNLSQEELGEKMFVSRQTVSQWETGQTMPSIESLIKLHEIFGVSVDEILGIAPIADDESIDEPDVEAVPEESYSFKFQPNEIKKAFSFYYKPPIKKMIICIALAIISLIISINATPNGVFYAAVFGVFVGYILVYIKQMISIKKVIKHSMLIMPFKSYDYEIQDGMITARVVENGKVTSEAVSSILDIKDIKEVNDYYVIVISGLSYIIKKSALNKDSKLFEQIKTLHIINNVATKNQTIWKTASIIAMIASIATPFVGMIIASFLSKEAGNVMFSDYMWVLYFLLPITVVSIIIGIIANKKKISIGMASIVIGAIFSLFLVVFGSFTFLFSSLGDTIDLVEEEMNIDIPNPMGVSASSGLYPSSSGAMISMKVIEISLSFDDTALFDESLNRNWLTSFPSRLDPVLAVDEEKYRADKCLLYNINTKEYNKIPDESGEYDMLIMLFCRSTCTLYIFEYDLKT